MTIFKARTLLILYLCTSFANMATQKKNNKKIKTPDITPEAPSAEKQANRKRRIRLGFGIFFLLTGLFITISIISYCFTWQLDQDKLLQSSGLSHFILYDKSPVANWGGRMGAALAHLLVYKSAGIASLIIGLWIVALGSSLIYGKRVLPFMRYLRWLSIILLVVAPVLAYILPNAAFPYGGAWGNEAINYMNGFLGTGGTGLVLLGAVCFVVFVVFALDITPLLRRARHTAKAVAATIAPTPVVAAEADAKEDDLFAPTINDRFANKLNDNDQSFVIDEETGEVLDSALVLTEKQEPAVEEEEFEDETEEEAEEEEIGEAVQLNIPAVAPKKKTAQEDPEFSFEVITQADEPTIKHGAHISIEGHEPYAPELDLPDYKFPTLDLLEDRSQETITLDKEELEKNKTQIIQTLRSFGIEIQRISATVGPTVTLYEIVPAEGIRISKIRNLEDDIALNLAALGIRIIAPIPGRGTIGIEVPNANKQIVSMRALLASEKFANSKMSLPIALGKKIDNENYIVDLATMPHLLMAGATGQGKSVGINAILVSLLYKKHPSQLKFVMVDPKKVELSIYRTIEKHFLAKLPNEEEAIITDTKKVIYTLNALCIEMDNRYELLKEAGARNIKEYNDKFINRRLNPEKGHAYLPFIVLVIDEFADLIMTAGKEVEMPIARLAQLARAVGIHLIIATQRPSVNVITGTIKANFPGRIAFKVSAKVDSRTILDAGGAEQLIGRGDMLVSHGSELMRLQCAFVDTPEVENVVEFIGKQRGYPSAFELPEYEGEDSDGDRMLDLTNRDDLFEDCARLVVQTQNGSTSNLQRRLNLGYNRAGRIMDQLESAGIVGPAMGSKPREVRFKTEAELEQFFNNNR
jgi:S-DNA-T family DNA segregation ATPase FtsK/SpoIIIE